MRKRSVFTSLTEALLSLFPVDAAFSRAESAVLFVGSQYVQGRSYLFFLACVGHSVWYEAHYTNGFLKKKTQMNLKGSLSSTQIFNAASPPINPTIKGFPYNFSYSFLWNSARLLMITSRCFSAIILTAREFIPCSHMSSDPTSSGRQLQLHPSSFVNRWGGLASSIPSDSSYSSELNI